VTTGPEHRVPSLLTPTGAVRGSWSLVIVLVAVFVAVGLSIGFTLRQKANDDHVWCHELLPALDTPIATPSPSASPDPLTVWQQRVARAAHDVRTAKC